MRAKANVERQIGGVMRVVGGREEGCLYLMIADSVLEKRSQTAGLEHM